MSDLAELDKQEPNSPSAEQMGILDALPHLANNLDQCPLELLHRLFDLTQLTIKIHYQSNEATLRITLPADYTSALGTIADTAMTQQPDSCGHTSGQSECATYSCPRSGSIRVHTDLWPGQVRTLAPETSMGPSLRPLIIHTRVPMAMKRRKQQPASET